MEINYRYEALFASEHFPGFIDFLLLLFVADDGAWLDANYAFRKRSYDLFEIVSA